MVVSKNRAFTRYICVKASVQPLSRLRNVKTRQRKPGMEKTPETIFRESFSGSFPQFAIKLSDDRIPGVVEAAFAVIDMFASGGASDSLCSLVGRGVEGDSIEEDLKACGVDPSRIDKDGEEIKVKLDKATYIVSGKPHKTGPEGLYVLDADNLRHGCTFRAGTYRMANLALFVDEFLVDAIRQCEEIILEKGVATQVREVSEATLKAILDDALAKAGFPPGKYAICKEGLTISVKLRGGRLACFSLDSQDALSHVEDIVSALDALSKVHVLVCEQDLG